MSVSFHCVQILHGFFWATTEQKLHVKEKELKLFSKNIQIENKNNPRKFR